MGKKEYSGQIYWEVIEPIWDEVSFYESYDIFRRGFSKLTEKQKIIYPVHWANSEICNGGLDQFFSNSTGMLAPEAETGFRVIGLVETARIIGRASQMLGFPFPRERADRQECLAKLYATYSSEGRAFDELDHAYYDSIDSGPESLEVILDRFASSP